MMKQFKKNKNNGKIYLFNFFNKVMKNTTDPVNKYDKGG
jgi:hypothetical protein